VQLADLVRTSAAVAGTSARRGKVEQLAALLGRVPSDEIAIAVDFLTGSLRQGRIGVGPALVQEVRAVPPAAAAELELGQVDLAFGRVASATGEGSVSARADILRDLFRRATAAEQDFLMRLLFGELRQGALEGVLVDAVARAAGLKPAAVRRAAMLAGALPPVAHAALAGGGEAALSQFLLRPFQPVQPMLADSAETVDEALRDLGEAVLEFKLDGARIQAHKVGDEVKIYSRNLRDVTPAVPEVVRVVAALPIREVVLDGEAIALRPDGTPHPFQVTMRRFGRKENVDGAPGELLVTPFFFDALLVDGQPIVDEPLERRLALLDRHVPAHHVVPRAAVARADEAAAFVARALTIGHEGVMAKSLASAYAAGRRGSAWLKVKEARTLDLVILAVEWGSGRRRGTLSNLHLGARDPEHGGFVMLGKTFKGLTDEMLAWQTSRLLQLEIGRDGHVVHVRPELVVEVAFNELQASPRYPGGLALRFARVKRYRTDKTAQQADTIAMVHDIHRQMMRLG
jgi:DNA ligase-1